MDSYFAYVAARLCLTDCKAVVTSVKWIAIALVIFAMWDPIRAAVGALLFGFINAFQFYCQAAGFTLIPGYILRMLPYLFTIGVLIIITRWEVARKRLGAPGALGIPFDREQ